MARFPMGNAGQAIPGRAPTVQIAEHGMSSARALERLGATGMQVATQMQADHLAAEQHQQRAEERERDAAAKAAASFNLADGRRRLRESAREIGERVIGAGLSEREADSAWQGGTRELLNQSTKDLPPELQRHVADVLRVDADELRGTVLGGALRQRRRDETRAGLLGTVELMERDAMVDRPRAVERVRTMLENLGADAGLSLSEQTQQLQAFRERTAYNVGRTLVRGAAADLDGLRAIEQRIGGDEFADLSPEARERLDMQITSAKQTLQHERERAATRAAAAGERRLKQAEHAAGALRELIDGGALPDEGFLAEVQQATAGTPWAAVARSALSHGADRAGFAQLPPSRQRERMLALRTQANTAGSNPQVEKRLADYERIAAATERDVEADALGWGVRRRLADGVEPLRFDSLDDLAAQLGSRREAATTIASHLGGKPVSPLFAPEAREAARMLAELPRAQQRSAVEMLARNLDAGQAGALARQLGGNDESLGLAMFAAVGAPRGGKDVADLILRGADARKAGRVRKAGDDGMAAADHQRIARELAEVSWPTAQARDTAVKAAQLVYDGLRDASGGSASPREAITLATGGLGAWGGRKVPMPPGWTENRFKAALREVDAVTLAGQMRGPVFVGESEIRAEDLAKAFGAATLVPVGPARYAIDTGGALVVDAQRRPWIFTLRD